MIFAKAFPYENIVENLDKETDVITIVGCLSCVRVSGCGGEEKMRELALRLRKDGFKVKDGFLILTACTPHIHCVKLLPEVNTVISLACSAGASNVQRSFPECKTVEAIEDIGLMVVDSDKKILKVMMAYEDHADELGKEYAALSGEKMLLNNELLTKEGE